MVMFSLLLMIYRFMYISILYLVWFIPYWNVNKYEQSSSILDFDVCDLDWIIYRRVIVTQSSLQSTRIIYSVSLLCADDPWTGALVPNSGLSFSWITTRVIDTTPTTDFASPGLWFIPLRWIVCVQCINSSSGLSVDESPCVPASRQPPPPPPRDYKLRCNKEKPCAPLDITCVCWTEHSNMNPIQLFLSYAYY